MGRPRGIPSQSTSTRTLTIRQYILEHPEANLRKVGEVFGVSREYIRQQRVAIHLPPLMLNILARAKERRTCRCGSTKGANAGLCVACRTAKYRVKVVCSRCGAETIKTRSDASNTSTRPTAFAGYDRYLCRPCKWRVGEPKTVILHCTACGIEIERDAAQARHNEKLNYRPFCSMACAAKVRWGRC